MLAIEVFFSVMAISFTRPESVGLPSWYCIQPTLKVALSFFVGFGGNSQCIHFIYGFPDFLFVQGIQLWLQNKDCILNNSSSLNNLRTQRKHTDCQIKEYR